VTAVTSMPNAHSVSATIAMSRTSATQEPCTSSPNSGPPRTNSRASWTKVTATEGSTLPTMMSTEVAGVARNLSHVPHPWSRKKVKPE
jgi:hypothetical protein